MFLHFPAVDAALAKINARATLRHPECLSSLRVYLNTIGSWSIEGFWNGDYLSMKTDSLGMAITAIRAIIGYSDSLDLVRYINGGDKGE